MSIRVAKRWVAYAAVASSLAVTAQASAAQTLTVDDDGQDCPAAAFTSIQAAVNAAGSGDTISVCPGAYIEGPGTVGSNALTIQKSLKIKGAGADLVRITPKAATPVSGQILESGTPSLHNGVGDIVAVVGSPNVPITVDISGVTVDGHTPAGTPVVVEAGILYLDARGELARDRVTNVVTSELDNAYTAIGGFRSSQAGYGIAQSSNAALPPVDGTRNLNITDSRIDKYNKIGVLIDGSVDETATPVVASGALNRGILRGVQVVGRTECINYAGTGNCGSVGLLTTGPLFGQDGVRATASARVVVTDSLISQNLVNGTGAPTRSTVNGSGVVTSNATNHANLTLGAGVRLQGAALNVLSSSVNLPESSIATSNITDNASGVLNYAADGSTVATGNPVATTTSRGNVLVAENNFWGLNYYRLSNPGPAISPTDNPPVPENGVTGTATADSYVDGTGTTVTGTTSNSVDFFPFRAGVQGDGFNGEYPIAAAPLAASDAPPTVALSSSDASVSGTGTVSLTAAAADDFGVKLVRFYDGTTLLGQSKVGPFVQPVTIAGETACGSTRTFTAIATDSAGQTKSSSTGVTRNCPVDPPAVPAGPSIGFGSTLGTVSGPRVLVLDVSAPAGVKSVTVTLGSRTLCTLTAAPYACRFSPTGADVGAQVLRAVVTDGLGRTAERAGEVIVAKFTPTISLAVKYTNARHGRMKRSIVGRLVPPAGVSASDACHGSITVVLKRDGQTFMNQQAPLSKSCTFRRSVTAAKSVKKSRYSVQASFGGSTVLSATTRSRRFS